MLIQRMKKTLFLLTAGILLAGRCFSQMYVLNEDFSAGAGTIPPNGWTNTTISGLSTDLWHFDNPGDRPIYFPITEPFAIFDGDSVSANGIQEIAALTTPVFDASVSNFILLQFDYTFEAGNGAIAKIEAYDGNLWQEIAVYSSSSTNPSSDVVDISSVTGGITNAMLRFVWQGNGSGYWAFDNIRVYASLPLDGGIVSIFSPQAPVSPGLQEVKVNLGNFGYNTITTTTINWSIDGVLQSPFNWIGSAGFGQTVEGISIGTYDFQDPVLIKIWQSNPNGQQDPNPYNDTLTKYLETTLCGTYTIGGADGDFSNFSQVAQVLNNAGVTCPVVLLIRDGNYYEQFMLESIPGSSEINTVTFRSESGDSTKARIQISPGAMKYEPMILLNGTKNLIFEDVGFATGSATSNSNTGVSLSNAHNIIFRNCYFESKNHFDHGLQIHGGSRQIEVINSRFESINARAYAVNIFGNLTRDVTFMNNLVKGATEWGFYTIRIGDKSAKILFEDNLIETCFRPLFLENTDSVRITKNIIQNSNYGVFVEDGCQYVEVSGNRLLQITNHPNVTDGTSGIYIVNSENIDISNNYVQTTGNGTITGINLLNADNARMVFNSLSLSNDDAKNKSRGISVVGCNSILVKNNISSFKLPGSPVYIENSQNLDFNNNDYFSADQTVGYFNGIRYLEIGSWINGTGMDFNSLSVSPFFTSDEDLSMNQTLLNNAAVPIQGIDFDIDGNPRNPITPDIGAKEYDPCHPDAGVNRIVEPVSPLTIGLNDVVVLLQNQGSASLSSVMIHWQVNDELQPAFPWTGDLSAGMNTEVSLGQFDFQSGVLYSIKAWTSLPNGETDCNPYNDTIVSPDLAAPLCGTYSVGGIDPDFLTLTEASRFLNMAGITCPVVFLVRDGEYFEQFVLGEIIGASSENTVTFISESGDSSLVKININQGAVKYEPIIFLDQAKHIRFKSLGFFTGAPSSTDNYCILMEGCQDVVVENCYLESRKDEDLGFLITDGSHEVIIRENHIYCNTQRAGAILVTDAGTRELEILNNTIYGATQWDYSTIKIESQVKKVNITGNHLERCMRAIHLANSDSILISNNWLNNVNIGIYLGDLCEQVVITRNRLTNIAGHPNLPDGTSAVLARNVSRIELSNNFIHSDGDAVVIGITLQSSTLCSVYFNSVNITNKDIQGKSRAIQLITSNQIITRNNIFSLQHKGVPVEIDTYQTLLDFDRNDYYNPQGIIGYYKGYQYTDLSLWSDSLNMDQNSFSVQPFFTSDTDPSINQSLLNNSGVPVDGVTVDIDNVLRDPVHPDIGAREYTPCTVDAGINALVSPANPLVGDVQDVIVVLQNQGTSNLQNVIINWEVNGVLQTPYEWFGNLGEKGNTEIMPGQFSSLLGGLYNLKIWTTLPNGTQDCNTNNDTLVSANLVAPLCGSYTIGGESPDFENFNEAAVALNSAGITCPVVFFVRDGIYSERIIIKTISGSSDENLVTFQSESHDSTLTVIKLDDGAMKFEPMVYLNGASNLVFKQIGFVTGNSVSDANTAVLMEGCSNVTLEGCNIESRKSSDMGVAIRQGSKEINVNSCMISCFSTNAGALYVTDEGTEDIGLTSNVIRGATNWGYTMIRITEGVKKMAISGNDISQCNRAIYLSKAENVSITGNLIRNCNDGIYIDNDCSAIDVSRNRLYNLKSLQSIPEGTNGIFIGKSFKVEVINNFIHTFGDGPSIGINLKDADSCRLHFNSVNITNADVLNKSKGLIFKNVSMLAVRNNIINIQTAGTPVQLWSPFEDLSLDYNNYYHPTGIIGIIDGEVYNNLYSWGLTITGDANSKTVNPYFKSDTVPLPFQRALNGAGIPIPGILYDIDGKLRYSQAPDVGCMEFFVDYGVLDLLSPTLDCYHSGEDSVTAYIRQWGDLPFEELKIAYQMNGGTIHYDTIPGPHLYDVIHTFESTVNITSYGDYLFKVWLINTLDDNINNDTLYAWRYSKPSPIVSFTYDNFCTGPKVFFFGEASVVEPYYIESYEWLFGDGDTSTLQNPVHLFTEPGTYNVAFRAYSDAGCYSEIILPVFIDPDFQVLQMDYNIVNETCLGDGTGSLEIIASGEYPPFTFFIDGVQIQGNFVSGFSSGKHEILIVDSENCSMIDSIEAWPAVYMDPEIFANPLSGLSPLTVEFDFTANGAQSWIWHFEEGITDTNKSPSYTFLNYGSNIVVLEVNSGAPHYCVETDTVEIWVDVFISIEVNTVFTPNADGINDYFEIRTTGIKDLEANIFNQWGNRVFQIDDVNGKWDGNTEGGAKSPDGTYFYAITADGVDFKTYTRQGSVLLLRNATQVYPNPVEAHLTVKTYDQLQPPVLVEVYSAFGQLVQSESISDPAHITLDLKKLGSGMYMIRITDTRQSYYSRILKK